MKPLYFGSSDAHLYGVYHPPLSTPRKTAVLLLYPGFHEYSAYHWDFRRLCGLLNQKGFPVFRFDYFGTGDSAGTTSEATLARYVESARTAADELLEQSGARKITLLGCRLGAAAGYLACLEGLRAAELVMWEPVLSGKEYLRQLSHWDDKRMSQLLHFTRQWGRGGDVLGHAVSESVRAQLLALDLRSADVPKGTRITLVSSEEDGFQREFEQNLRAKGGSFTRIASPVPGPRDTDPPSDEAQNAGALLGVLADHVAREALS
jgi:uncharacterized protein